MRKPIVLVVDDKPANFVAIEAVLGADHDLVFAGSGAQALALLEQRSDIDVILMDVQMPSMDGFETALAVKKMPACGDIPIVFVTAVYKEDPFIRKGFEVGGIDYFSKPFDPEILRQKIAIYSTFRLKAELLKERERQVRASEELVRAGRKLSAMLESLPVGVLIADQGSRIVQATDEVSRILRAEETMAKDAYGELLRWWERGGQMIKDRHGPLARALGGESSHSERVPIRCFDGSVKTVLASASPLRGIGGETVGAVVLLQDIQEARQIEQDLEQRVTRLVGAGVELEAGLAPTPPRSPSARRSSRR